MPALLETAVRLVMLGRERRVLIRVSGTPQSPKPPARRVLLDWREASAERAEGRTLLMASGRGVEEKQREGPWP